MEGFGHISVPAFLFPNSCWRGGVKFFAQGGGSRGWELWEAAITVISANRLVSEQNWYLKGRGESPRGGKKEEVSIPGADHFNSSASTAK